MCLLVCLWLTLPTSSHLYFYLYIFILTYLFLSICPQFSPRSDPSFTSFSKPKVHSKAQSPRLGCLEEAAPTPGRAVAEGVRAQGAPLAPIPGVGAALGALRRKRGRCRLMGPGSPPLSLLPSPLPPSGAAPPPEPRLFSRLPPRPRSRRCSQAPSRLAAAAAASPNFPGSQCW